VVILRQSWYTSSRSLWMWRGVSSNGLAKGSNPTWKRMYWATITQGSLSLAKTSKATWWRSSWITTKRLSTAASYRPARSLRIWVQAYCASDKEGRSTWWRGWSVNAETSERVWVVATWSALQRVSQKCRTWTSSIDVGDAFGHHPWSNDLHCSNSLCMKIELTLQADSWADV